MKGNQIVCDRILKSLERQSVNPEYKMKMTYACEMSKKLNYKVSPYEINFVSNNKGMI